MNIIPIMYSKGIEVVPIPTGIFTSHGGFSHMEMLDNADFMDKYTEQYEKLNIDFSGIYLGLFSSEKQFEAAENFLSKIIKEKSLIVYDPILGDNGKMYSFLKSNILTSVKRLIKRADVITPNLTEAALILGKEYKRNYSYNEIYEILKELSFLGPENIVLTSAGDDDSIFIYTYEKGTNKIEKIIRKRLKGSYPGTGDAFTSVLMSELLSGKTLKEACIIAAQFVEELIKLSMEKGYNNMEGLPIAEFLKSNMR